MAGDSFRASLDPRLESIARAIAESGGRAVLVGGFVRDHLLGNPSKDYDVEVHGLPLARLEEILERSGEVIAVGRAFGVLRVKGIDCDFSLPRRDSKVGRGHRGFITELDPSLDFAEASRRRDLTINSMGLDIVTGEVLDPHGGRRDLAAGVLRATDPLRFPEDPLRGLRVAQLAARFEMGPDPELIELSSRLDLSELAPERMFEEFRKLLLRGARPSLGLEFLRQTGLLSFFPELAAMVGVRQDPEWHPEGTVWEHTLLVVDEAARARAGNDREDEIVLFAALCHDIGKPATTVVEGDRVRSPNHDREGEELARGFLARLRAPHDLMRGVEVLVRYHLAPAQFPPGKASPRAYRRLARRLEEGGVNARLLYRLAEADHFGRTTPDALARSFPEGEEFLRQATDLHVEERAPADAVLGRHLIARGMKPGSHFGEILARCREIQEETGWEDPERILERCLEGEAGGAPPEGS